MPFKNYSLTKNGQLTIGQILSPNFIAGVSGWEIRKDGSAEFNNGTFRGTISGGTLIISQGSGATFVQVKIDGSTGITTWSKYQSPTVIIRQILANGTDLVYADPGNGNAQGALIASVSQTSGTDQFSNAYVSGVASYNGGITVNLTNGTLTLTPVTTGHTPALVTSFTGELILTSPTETAGDTQSQALLLSKTAAAAATPTGVFQVTDGIDGQTYNTQVRTLSLSADSGTLTSLTTLLSSPVGIRKYRIHGQLFISATSGAQFTCEIVLPTGASGKFGYTISHAATFVGQVTGGPNASVGVAISLGTNVYSITIDGLLTVTAAGTMNFQAGSLTATGLVVQQSSSIDIIPA